MKFAQILHDRAHWIFEAEEKPEFAPDIILIDITGNDKIQEGWLFDKSSQTFEPPVYELFTGPHVPTLDEIAEEQLLETKYQTFLLEMMV
ncbi:hypothetical protein AB1K09_06505 [Solibacillus silvestris]